MLSLQPPVEPSQAAEGAQSGFNAGETIMEHVSNTSVDHPMIHLPHVFGVDVTVTANYNVTAALATIAFFAIIVAGTRAHGFIQHWKNLVPSGMPVYVYPILVPIEIMGMFVRPFALTMRLAGNMVGGHIAILA